MYIYSVFLNGFHVNAFMGHMNQYMHVCMHTYNLFVMYRCMNDDAGDDALCYVVN